MAMLYDPKQLERLHEAIEAPGRLRRGEWPNGGELSAAPLLEGWYLTEHYQRLALGGKVTGHPSLPDGAHIATSWLLWLSDDRLAARTMSRFYRRGTALEDVLATKS